MSEKINGGYYIKARCIQESAIATAPPHVREIWDWLLKECNYCAQKSSGRIIERGQCARTYKDMQDGLHWMIGWRKMTYSKGDCETAMKLLKKHTMITTQKTTRGMVITVLNYDKYQDPRRYETYNEVCTITTREPQTDDTINKKVNQERKESIGRFTPPTPDEVKKYCIERNNGVDHNKWFNFYEAKGWMVGKNKMKNWQAAVRTWEEKKEKSYTEGRELPKIEEITEEQRLKNLKTMEEMKKKLNFKT